MKQTLLLFLLLFSGLLQQAQAQDRTISGKVVDQATGQGLPGVTVIVKDKGTIGTSTNAEGVYALPVPAGTTTLVFSFVGYATQEAAVTSANTVNISLATDAKQLNEVVVTALGVERTRNSLAYSATQVTGTDITVARNPNAINGLSGKVAGLSIQQSNTLGGSSNVVIRGTKSITGNNQALFVVDGVPISNLNTNSAGQQSGQSGYDYGNAAADINPDDIASTTVLKGAAATALYGSRAANGVILITTKKGRKNGMGVTINSGVTLGRIDKSTFIKYQKQYGGGYGRYYGPTNPYFNDSPTGELVAPTSEDASYGAPFDPNLLVRQWYSYTPGDPNFGQATPWTAGANDPSTFFQTAASTLNTIVVDGGSDNGTFKLGYNNNIDRGVLPNSKITKNTLNFAGSLNLNPKLTLSTNINFTRVDGLGRYGTGYGSENIMTNFRQWWETNLDVSQLKDAYFRNNTNATWNFASPENGDLSAIYWNNPYFVRYQNYENDTRYRTFGNVMANYKVLKGLEIVGRLTVDSYDEFQEERSAVGSTQASYVPYYSRYNHTYREFNYDLFANFNKSLGTNFTLQGVVGTNLRRQYDNSLFATTNGGLVVPGLYSLANSANSINAPSEGVTQVGVDGFFASATLGFRDRIFLDLTSRVDRSTTLPVNSNTYYYPSAALGYVFSEDLHDAAPWLSYGKVRANYAEVGNDAPALSVFDTYRKPAVFGSTPLFALPTTKNNPDLKSERTRSFEAGVETAYLDNRLGLEATIYQQSTINQILPVSVSAATGYISRYVNSGEVRNRGLELSAFVVPVKTGDVNWRLSANWSRNENTVRSLYQGVDNIILASYQGGITSNATVNEAYGTLRGTNFVYLDGQRVVGANGYYQMTDANQEIGNPTPRWRGGITNTVSYKSISLNFLVDIKSGGSVFSLDRYYGLATGLQPETAGSNDLGNPSRTPVADGGGVILAGVQADGSANTVRVSNSNYGLYGYLRNPAAAFVYDASYVKLREVALTIGLPKSLLAKTPFLKGADFSIIGRNLWIIHKNLPDADPEDVASSGNIGQGYQGGAYPAVRTVGANLRLRF
ncbi:SusC/RagA family TonB-linked outer membrane protein [Hymenobacter coccineus]|uniref:SusC/RagA family protein n=1 Tax=Hymenobacter coccineus TaxID=1908235 RepID=A0A1G1TGD9_9BACT|nr:SusC/RagA family TonB-linked outer membrane protein [Hymenobacter coccineus]OGX89940.1 SusC/RagA family protein [Hymenobacter coccineus]